jgi:hypothetical protein
VSDLVKAGEIASDLALSDADLRAKFHGGETAAALRAIGHQVDDFIANDALLQEFQNQVGNLGANMFGGLVLGGHATWAPVRGPGDWSEWGPWEVWEECRIGSVNDGKAIGPIPTGAWLIWNSAQPEQMGGVPASQSNGRLKAELWAVLQNGGKKTRVVPHGSQPSASSLDYHETLAKVGAEMERLSAEIG